MADGADRADDTGAPHPAGWYPDPAASGRRLCSFVGGAGPMHGPPRDSPTSQECTLRLWSYLRGVKDPTRAPDPAKPLLHTEMSSPTHIPGLFDITIA
jgi:hypothetical protein